MGHFHLDEAHSHRTERALLRHGGHDDVGDLPRGGGPFGLLGVHERDPVVEVQLVDDERLAAVQVHRARMHGRRCPAAVDGAEHPSGVGFDDGDLGADAAADVDVGVRTGVGG